MWEVKNTHHNRRYCKRMLRASEFWVLSDVSRSHYCMNMLSFCWETYDSYSSCAFKELASLCLDVSHVLPPAGQNKKMQNLLFICVKHIFCEHVPHTCVSSRRGYKLRRKRRSTSTSLKEEISSKKRYWNEPCIITTRIFSILSICSNNITCCALAIVSISWVLSHIR